ncbi:O-methyltransferase bik3 [Beauveria bassiana]|uniref:O-methyltransferase-like protein n=1 Tax=Beauveria bassiana (strain ARSEF 2860) TaxID=655819 RepID=J4UFJ2_BEAB2|nr:O-methyltransferase-like protein [Beauveria bassiana ARSEF 2860]EJP61307.1 O-methyltransferase-like protein [Beauveria bassiana ARSEF 2860]KAF1735589.1 O-methyltransferase bik3 [Beauveria bassiana]KAH8711148.1 Chlorophenol O-methyltransferase [Beauveria bassiana]
MGKFKSWIQGSSAGPSRSAATEEKKLNRRSFSGIAQLKSKRETESRVGAKEQDLESRVSTQMKPDMSADSRMISLAKIISAESNKLESYCRSHGIPTPSFDADAPKDFPKLPDDIQKSRHEIIFAASELSGLVRGPRESVRWGVWGFLDSLTLQIINHYGIATLVPTSGTISFAELQSKTSLDAINLARVLRHAMTSHIFCEPKPGAIAHTALSRCLAEDDALQNWIGFNSEDIFPAAANVVKSLEAHPEATSLTTTGFNFAFNTVGMEPMFVTFGKNPKAAKRMGAAMASLTGGEGYEVRYFVDNYDLSDVDKNSGTLVDIGGSHGFVCVDLAKKWKNMKFIVQDLPKTVESAPSPISEDDSVASRITLQAHDFFKEQPIKGADVYFFRWIIHNYSTPYATGILKNLVPSLKPGARIVINDHCLRQPGMENPWDEKLMRGMDMIMLTLLNAQERDENEFKALFAAADPRFKFQGVTRVQGCRMSVIEALWDPEQDPAPWSHLSGDEKDESY